MPDPSDRCLGTERVQPCPGLGRWVLNVTTWRLHVPETVLNPATVRLKGVNGTVSQ